MNAKRRMLGPFSVLADDVKLAGFFCGVCKEPVRVAKQHAPTLAARACLFGCGCDVGVVVWEDQSAINRQNWSRVMKQARKANAELIIFNTGETTPPGFGGVN